MANYLATKHKISKITSRGGRRRRRRGSVLLKFLFAIKNSYNVEVIFFSVFWIFAYDIDAGGEGGRGR